MFVDVSLYQTFDEATVRQLFNDSILQKSIFDNNDWKKRERESKREGERVKEKERESEREGAPAKSYMAVNSLAFHASRQFC